MTATPVHTSAAGTEPAQPGRLRQWVRDRPISTFLALTLLFSWWPWPLYALGWSGQPVAGFGPFLAAVATLALSGTRGGIQALWASMRDWRIGANGWLLVLGTPVLLTSLAAAVNLALGAAASFHTGDLASVPLTFLLCLLIPGFGGAWEEPGWRGYAFPLLAQRHSWVKAALFLGVVGSLWHVPLVLCGLDSPWELALLLGVSVVLARIVMTTGSVLSLMALHAMNNGFSGNFVTPMFDGADAERQAMLTALMWTLAAVAAVVASRKADSRS